MLKKAVDHIITNNIKTKNEYQLTDALQIMLKWGESFQVFDIENCLDCGTRKTLLETNAYLLTKKAPQPPMVPGAIIIPPVYLGPGVALQRSIVGPNVHIGKGCQIVNSILSNSIISEGAVLKDVILSESLIGQKSQLIGVIQHIDTADHTIQKLS